MSGKTGEFARVREAYLNMATEGRYRPQAPGDGMGSVDLNDEELADAARLDQEASEYAAGFIRDEDAGQFNIGTSNYQTNRALVYVIEAAKSLCGGQNQVSLRLLKMAIKEINEAEANPPA
jgi:hypothetical protein